MKLIAEHCVDSAHNCGFILLSITTLWISVHNPDLRKGTRREKNEVSGSLFREFAFLGGKVKLSHRAGGSILPLVKGTVEFGV